MVGVWLGVGDADDADDDELGAGLDDGVGGEERLVSGCGEVEEEDVVTVGLDVELLRGVADCDDVDVDVTVDDVTDVGDVGAADAAGEDTVGVGAAAGAGGGAGAGAMVGAA